MALVSLIHPSRSRAKKAYAATWDWLHKSGVEVEYILSIDNDDPDKETYYELFKDQKIVCNDNRSAVDAINNAAKICTGDIIVQMAEDQTCEPDWGKRLIDLTKGKTDWIAKTHDGIQKWIITLPIMDRAYYNRFGYVYYPEYLHLFCDTELTCVADLLDRKIELNLPFIHNHYSTGKTPKDEVSIKADATWAQGEKLFIDRYKRNFDLVNPPGKIKSEEYLNWIKGKV